MRAKSLRPPKPVVETVTKNVGSSVRSGSRQGAIAIVPNGRICSSKILSLFWFIYKVIDVYISLLILVSTRSFISGISKYAASMFPWSW